MKRIALLLALLMLIPACAAASLPTQFSHPPRERVMIDLPDGLDADAVYNETSGVYTVTVYVESTTDEEWAKALAAGYDTREGYLYLTYSILPPEHVSQYRQQGWGDTGLTEGEMIERMSKETASYGSDTITASQEIGQYFANAQMLDLIPLPQSYGALNTVRWVFGDQTELYESVGIVIQFKKNRQSGSTYDPDMFTAALPLLPGENIRAEASNGTKVSVQSGKVSFVCGDSSKEIQKKVYLTPPDEAWKPYFDDGREVPQSGSAYQVLNDTLASGTDALDTSVVRITWKDRSGAEKAVHFLTIETIRGNVKLWPAYARFQVGENEWKDPSPFPKERVNFSLTQDIPGLSVSYDEKTGVARFHADQETLSRVKDKDIAQAMGSLKLTADPRAEKFVFQTYGGILYGPGNQFNFTSWNPEEIEPSRIVPYDQTVDAFIDKRTYRLADGSTGSYFVNASEHYMPYTGWLMYYCWLDENEKEIALEYIAVEYDPVMLETTTPALESDDELHKNAGKPQVILKKGGNKNHYSLHAKQYPSSGNTHYYELKLIDQYGDEAFLESEADVYLPYPSGYSMDNCHELVIEIIHYDKNGRAIKESFSVAEGTLDPKPYGLRFTVKDFSPFVMTWEEKADAAALPQTGDHSSLLLFAVLMSASILGVLAMKKRYN